MSDSVEVQIARLEEQNKAMAGVLESINAKMDEASSSRKKVYARQETMARDIFGLTHRMEGVEREVRAIRPANEEYVRYRERVRGAGLLGVALWKVGGVVLLAAGWLYSAYLTVVGRPPP